MLAEVLLMTALAEFVIPAAPTARATDLAGYLPEASRHALDCRLKRYEERTGRQVWVWIGTKPSNVDPQTFGHVTFNAWGVGSKKRDDGVVLWIFPADEWWHITVGYGLERYLTDREATDICVRVAWQGLKVGDREKAVNDAVSAILVELRRATR